MRRHRVIVRQSVVPRRVYVFPRHPRTSSTGTVSYTLVLLDAPRWMPCARLGSQLDASRTHTSHVRASWSLFNHVHVQPTTTSTSLHTLVSPPTPHHTHVSIPSFLPSWGCFVSFSFSFPVDRWMVGWDLGFLTLRFGWEGRTDKVDGDNNHAYFHPTKRRKSMGSHARDDTPEHTKKKKVRVFAKESKRSTST